MRAPCLRWTREIGDDRGSSPVEFVLVGLMLTVLTLGVLQLGLAIYVRNIVHDAAVEGAFHGALADTTPQEGAERTREIIARTVGAAYAADVSAQTAVDARGAFVVVIVRAPLPVAGLLGAPRAMEVTAHAPQESLD
ncbi:TadE/TadG family type IV pilus assembly protein [Microbacter sp. GSS18]|nr:TadE/TadG family type IV pilus assembly protein [Microbacter sp. GSS18]